MKRLLAKLAYRLSVLLFGVKTYQRVYEMDLNGDEFTSKPAGRAWLPNTLAVKLLSWSQTLDWAHWPHWALEHDDCFPFRCGECGGQLCGDEDLDQ
jgi:hypothetical protein